MTVRFAGSGDKNWRPTRREPAYSDLARRVDELRASLRPLDPELVAARSGMTYLSLDPDRGALHFPFWGKLVTMAWPDLNAHNDVDDPLPTIQQAIFLYHLLAADGSPLAGEWVSFAELPGGRMYNTAFQGYTGDEISKHFGLDLHGFKLSCEEKGGQPFSIGDAAYRFQALPRVDLLVVYHLGDDDFPSSCKILFDRSVTHYLPIDGCAILGSMLAKRVLMQE